MSPSGKALAFQASIRGFESRHPLRSVTGLLESREDELRGSVRGGRPCRTLQSPTDFSGAVAKLVRHQFAKLTRTGSIPVCASTTP